MTSKSVWAVVHADLQGRKRRVGPLGQVTVLDRAEDRLDPVQRRTVRRQEVEVDPLFPQAGPGFLDRATVMQRRVVQHDHQRQRARWSLQQEEQQIVRG